MAELDNLALVMVLVIVIEGVWLAGLTYFMWRRHLQTKKQKEEKKPPEQAN